MIRRSPAEYYFKYLVSHPDRYSDEHIKETLEVQGLDWLDGAYIARVRRQTVAPTPFHPYDREHPASMRFLHRHRLFAIYHPDAAMREAWAILEKPKLKEFVEAMTLAGAPFDVIAKGAHHAVRCSPLSEAGVQRFVHYFWNTDLLDFTEMRAVVARRGSSSKDPAYKKAFYKDSRKVAAELPFSPLSAAISQIRLGITPRGINFAELMERVRTVAGIRTYQWLLEDHPDAGEVARNFITVATTASDLLERSEHPEEKLLERFNSLGIEHDTTPIPHIAALSEGNHTTDLQLIEATAQVVEVDDEHSDTPVY